MRKANTTSVNKHEPSYEQLEVKTDRTSFYVISDDITYSTICRNVFILYNIGSYQLSLKYLTYVYSNILRVSIISYIFIYYFMQWKKQLLLM
jgi:hypothetical protein